MKALSGLHLLLATVAVALATFLIVLDYSIANVSIPYIAGDLAVAVDQGTYVITSFAVGSAIILPITGWLTRRLGLIRLLSLSLLGFTILSWVCGMSQSMGMLVVARFFQGVAGGPLIPLSQSIIVLIFPPEKRNTALSFWSMVVVTAPILGPILGGWICYDYSWPWIFFINIPVGIFSWFIIISLLKSYETERKSEGIDWVGLLLLALGTTTLQILLDKGQQFDWLNSPIIVTCLVTSILSFLFLLAWEKDHPKPLIELKLFKTRSYALSVLFIAVAYAIYFGSVVLIPLWLQTDMGYTPVWAGLAVAPIGIMPLLFSGLVGKLNKRIGPLILLGVSFALFAASCFATAFLTTEVDIWHISFSRFLLGFGLLFFIVPLFAMSIQDMPNEKLPTATGIFHYVRAMVGGIGTSVFTTLWLRRGIFHHINVASSLNHAPVHDQKTLAILNTAADVQASMLSINDCFYLMGWIFICLIPFLLLGVRFKNPSEKISASKRV